MTAEQVKSTTAVPTAPALTVRVPGLVLLQRVIPSYHAHADSQPSLQGKHVAQDKETAIELWKQAADAGHPKAT